MRAAALHHRSPTPWLQGGIAQLGFVGNPFHQRPGNVDIVTPHSPPQAVFAATAVSRSEPETG